MNARNLLCLAAVAAAIVSMAGQRDAAPSLRDLLRPLLVGAAVNQRQVEGGDPAAVAIVERHFNTITPENVLKWARVHPDPERYEFDPADRYVAFGQSRHMFIVGHTLVWHQQIPRWVFTDANGRAVDRPTLLARMRAHIEAVVGRYRGRVHGWDVVNEALNDDGTLRQTPWLSTIGEEYIASAFEYARQADPGAELYYNDYNLWKPEKRDAALRLVKRLRDRGLRVDGIGEQAHWLLDAPAMSQVEATVTAISKAGLKPMFTEMDVDVLPRDPALAGADLAQRDAIRAATDVYRNGLPEPAQRRLAARYAEIFSLVARHRGELARVTFWGVTDGSSWLNNFPVRGRTNHPLLWDRQGKPKPALAAVLDVLASPVR